MSVGRSLASSLGGTVGERTDRRRPARLRRAHRTPRVITSLRPSAGPGRHYVTASVSWPRPSHVTPPLSATSNQRSYRIFASFNQSINLPTFPTTVCHLTKNKRSHDPSHRSKPKCNKITLPIHRRRVNGELRPRPFPHVEPRWPQWNYNPQTALRQDGGEGELT